METHRERESGEYPPVVEILMWFCHGLTCGECGYDFSENCPFKKAIAEYVKSFVFIEPSLS